MIGRQPQGFSDVVSHRREITAEMLRKILDYNPGDGVFRWRTNRGYKTCVGTVAGSKDKGRWTIGVYGKRCQSANLAWLWMTGEWPSADVDHKDRDKSNNKWGNLREATRSQNCMNKGARKDSGSGLKGISPHAGGKWRARIGAQGVRYDLGVFRTQEDAAAAYRVAASAIHGRFSGV